MAADVARLETDNWHTLHTERGDGNLAWLVWADGAVVVVEKLHDGQVGFVVRTALVFALHEGRLHLGGGIVDV